MDLMNGIASMAMSLQSASLQQNYSIAVAKKSMETQEMAAQELLRMLQPQQSVIDVYA